MSRKFNRGWISFECTIPLYVTGNINVTIGGRIFPVDIANNNFSIVVDRLTIFNFFFFSPPIDDDDKCDNLFNPLFDPFFAKRSAILKHGQFSIDLLISKLVFFFFFFYNKTFHPFFFFFSFQRMKGRKIAHGRRIHGQRPPVAIVQPVQINFHTRPVHLGSFSNRVQTLLLSRTNPPPLSSLSFVPRAYAPSTFSSNILCSPNPQHKSDKSFERIENSDTRLEKNPIVW